MNPTTTQASFSPPWFLILGVLAGVAFVGFIVWDSSGTNKSAVATGGNVVELTQANWQTEVVETKVPVVVDFTAKWCGPCQQYAPIVERLAERYKGKVKIAKFDVGNTSFNKATKLQEKYDINGIPHIMIFTGGHEPRHQFQRPPSEEQLARAIDGILANQ